MHMRTRFLALALAAVTAVTATGVTAFAVDSVVHEGFTTYTIKGVEYDYLFAAGEPVVITDREDGRAGATISWKGATKDVGPETIVFGGYHAKSDLLATTDITMEGGTIYGINGGGLHAGRVTSANITIKGGTLSEVTGGGVSSSSKTSGLCGCEHTTRWFSGTADETKNGAYCRVDTVNIVIEDGTLTRGLIYGGGEGFGYTGAVNMTIEGGDMSAAYVTAGGTNGYTGEAKVTVTGGAINVLQGANRGSMDTIDFRVTGGGSGDALEIAKDAFWADAKAKIRSAEVGSTVEIDMKRYTEFPWTVMRTLNEHPVTLVIKRTEGKTITIPAGEAQSTDNNIIYFMMDRLEKLYAKAD